MKSAAQRLATRVAARDVMRIHYYSQELNFGDDLNRWLWEALLPGCWSPDDEVNFCGIGTLVNAMLPAKGTWLVFTSGVGYGAPPSRVQTNRWTVVCVRGPLSAAVLRLSPAAALTDGALLLAALPQYAPVPASERRGIVFVPHHRSEDLARWDEVCQRAGIEFVSARQDSRVVIERIRSARLVLADAMHAAITADALRVPWVPVSTSPQTNTFKWLDWTASMNLPYRPRVLPSSTVRYALRSSMVWAHNHQHRFRAEGPAQALAYFESRYVPKPSTWWRATMRAGRWMQARTDRLLASPLLAARVEARDEIRLDRAAEALIDAASESYLSDDRVHRDRLDALCERLADVRAFARGGDAAPDRPPS